MKVVYSSIQRLIKLTSNAFRCLHDEQKCVQCLWLTDCLVIKVPSFSHLFSWPLLLWRKWQKSLLITTTTAEQIKNGSPCSIQNIAQIMTSHGWRLWSKAHFSFQFMSSCGWHGMEKTAGDRLFRSRLLCYQFSKVLLAKFVFRHPSTDLFLTLVYKLITPKAVDKTKNKMKIKVSWVYLFICLAWSSGWG